MSITPATVDSLRDLFHQMQVQLKASDDYAKQNKSQTDKLPSIWELQNLHLRNILNDCIKLIEG